MRKFVILFLTFLVPTVYVSAQDSYINNRWNIKAGYSIITTRFFIPENSRNYRLELNYGFLDKIESGIYVGYSRIPIYIQTSPSSFNGGSAKAYFYGINCNYHLFPLIIKEDDFRFDLYLTGKLGGLHIETKSGIHPEYSVGGGAAFYIFKHIGAFAEYGYGKYYEKDNKKFRYGLSIKF